MLLSSRRTAIPAPYPPMGVFSAGYLLVSSLWRTWKTFSTDRGLLRMKPNIPHIALDAPMEYFGFSDL